MEKGNRKRSIYFFAVVISIVILGIAFIPQAIDTLSILTNALTPLLIGLLIAYIVNIPMKFYEKHFPDKKNKIPHGVKTAICLLLAIVTIVLAVGLVAALIVPELQRTIEMLGRRIPDFVEELSENKVLGAYLGKLQDVNWEDAVSAVVKYLQGGLTSVVGGSIGLISSLASWILTGIFGLIFSLYFLTGKEKLLGQSKRLVETLLPEKANDWVLKCATVANECFHNYFVGRFMDAIIMGVLCAIGMAIFRFEYVTMISVVVGFTALIPILGAYIGALIGFVLLFTVSPREALLFLVFILVLQQLEGNLVFPKVVGSTIGLPGVWLLGAVTVFSALAGFTGIILGVPFVATVYRLLQIRIRAHANEKKEPK